MKKDGISYRKTSIQLSKPTNAKFKQALSGKHSK
jgi:hypothetical protein